MVVGSSPMGATMVVAVFVSLSKTLLKSRLLHSTQEYKWVYMYVPVRAVKIEYVTGKSQEHHSVARLMHIPKGVEKNIE